MGLALGVLQQRELNTSNGTLEIDSLDDDFELESTHHLKHSWKRKVLERTKDNQSKTDEECGNRTVADIVVSVLHVGKEEAPSGEASAPALQQSLSSSSMTAFASSLHRLLFNIVTATTMIAPFLLAALLLGVATACHNGACTSDGIASTNTLTSGNFGSLFELYEAVDAYLLLKYGGGNDTEVLHIYGDPIGTWNVGNVESFVQLFDAQGRNALAANFDEDLSGWDTSKATSLKAMFRSAETFSGHGIEAWNTSRVLNLQQLFQGCRSFNGNVSLWDVSRVTTMKESFAWCPEFDCNMGSWDVSQVQSFDRMFIGAHRFNRDLSTWKTTRLRHAQGMVSSSICDNKHLKTQHRSQFQDAYSFNGDVSSFDLSAAKDLSNMFAYSSSFNGDLANWNTSSTRTMKQMFYFAQRLTGAAISSWDVSNVVDTSYMFAHSGFKGDVSNWNIGSLTNATEMFAGLGDFYQTNCSLFESQIYIENAQQNECNSQQEEKSTESKGGRDQLRKDIRCVDAVRLLPFQNGTELMEAVDVYIRGNIGSEDVENKYGPLATWNVSLVENFDHLFDGYRNPNMVRFNPHVDCWNTSNARSMEGMFRRAYSFSGDLSSWDVSRVTTMKEMFTESMMFNGNISRWDTGNVVDFSSMFAFQQRFNADIGAWNVSLATNMSSMFRGSRSFNRDISRWDIGRVNDARDLFGGAGSFNQNLCLWRHNLKTTTNTQNIFTASTCFVSMSTKESLADSFCHPCSLLYNDTGPRPCGSSP